MIRRWAGPIGLAVLLAVVTWFVTLSRTPETLMATAVSRLGKAGMNSFAHSPLATSKSRAIVRPSPDLAYSSCPFDLSRGALVVTVEPVPALYWSLSVFQANTDVALVRNNVETHGRPITVVVAQEGQVAPAGAEVVRVKGARGVALIRVLVDDRAHFPAIDAARHRSTCRVLATG
ncbi:DUF1254 domain-containing protein [Sphingomonas sp. TX0543]|uniref:DUF1254 domain-containing protein n=1 Tax=unclassified Sphingomonas TaxID=196159 RepID=UPI0014850686|nr:DUF1254 domain-containing protein [Sphingomonas sp. 3P27F8]